MTGTGKVLLVLTPSQARLVEAALSVYEAAPVLDDVHPDVLDRVRRNLQAAMQRVGVAP